MSLPLLLLLHGALGAASQFVNLKVLIQDDFEVISPDFPGHGERKMQESKFSFPYFVSDIITKLDKKKIPTIDIFGYSMGGYAALWMAKNYPQRVNSIFTMATKFDWNELSAQREASMLNPEKVLIKIPAFANTLRQRHQQADWMVVMKKTAEMLEALGKDHMEDKDFRSISHRVKIGIGDQDNMVSMAESENISKTLQSGSLHVFSNTPHPFEKVDQQMLAKEIKSWFIQRQ